MARHCVRWASGRKHGGGGRRRRRGGRHCKYGVVRRGRRRGQCLKSRRARKYARGGPTGSRAGYRRMVP